jgi:endonuclease V-like protein UPF0215 family
VRRRLRPHVLGIDDGPFDKRRDREVPIVGVMMEGHDLVEAVVATRFPVDGPDAATFLARWIGGLRLRPALQAVVLGGITIAGLGVVDVEALARALRRPVLVANRRDPAGHRLKRALAAAGLLERSACIDRTPPAWPLGPRLHVAVAGADRQRAEAIVRAIRGKSELPEPLRVAHLVARAIATGESRGRP